MRRISVDIPLKRVLFDTGEGSTLPGAEEKLQAALLSQPKLESLPFHRKDTFIPPGVVNNYYQRHSAYYMRY